MADDPVLELTVDGTVYRIRFDEFNALDAREFRRELGTGMAAAFTESPDLDTIAGVLWLHRRKTNPKLKFADVARELTYLDFEVDDDSNSDDEEDGSQGDDNPET